MNAWDGELHFDGNTFAETRALIEKENDMPLLDIRIVIGVVAIGAAVIFCWFCFHNGRRQLLELDKDTGRPYRAETIELLHQRAARLRRDR